jgi:hypothetical protein
MGGQLRLAVPKGDPQEITEKEENTVKTDNKEQKRPNTFVKDGIEIHSHPGKRTFWGIVWTIVGLVGSCSIFEATYWLLSNFDIDYYWQSIVAVIFAFMAIQIYNKATGDMPSLLRTPIIFFTIMIFVLSLLIGYHHSEGKSAGHLDKLLWTAVVHNDYESENSGSVDYGNYQKKFGIVKNPGEVWVADHLPENTVVTVKIRGAAAVINGEELLPSDYAVKTDGDGKLICEGTRRITTSIEVIP